MFVEQGSEGGRYLAELKRVISGIERNQQVFAGLQESIEVAINKSLIGPIRLVEVYDQVDVSRFLIVWHDDPVEDDDAPNGKRVRGTSFVYQGQDASVSTLTVDGLEGFSTECANRRKVQIPIFYNAEEEIEPRLIEVEVNQLPADVHNPFDHDEYGLGEYHGTFRWWGEFEVEVTVYELNKLVTFPENMMRMKSFISGQNPDINLDELRRFNEEMNNSTDEGWGSVIDAAYAVLGISTNHRSGE